MSRPPIRIVILCAKFEEAEQFRQTLCDLGSPVREVRHDNIVYDHLDFQDLDGYPLSLDLYSGGTESGSVMSSEMATQILHQTQPHWLLMTGVCAGNPHKVNLGDLIIADRVWDLRSGKAVVGQILPELHVPSINPHLSDPIQRTIKMIEQQSQGWSSLIRVNRPISPRYKKEVLRQILYDHRIQQEQQDSAQAPGEIYGLEIRDIQTRVQSHASCPFQECAALLKKMSQATTPLIRFCERSFKYYLDADQEREIRRLRSQGQFPMPDPTQPQVALGIVATDLSTVRADLSPDDWRRMEEEGDRNVLGLEMEGYGIYQAVYRYNTQHHSEPRPQTQALLVKGVSDVGDPEKDDEFHKYGKRIAAGFVYQFLRRYGYKLADRRDLNNQTQRSRLQSTIEEEKKTQTSEIRSSSNLTQVVPHFKSARLIALQEFMLQVPRSKSLAVMCAITGVAGCGKTELAKEYARYYGSDSQSRIFRWRLDVDPGMSDIQMSYEPAYLNLLENFSVNFTAPNQSESRTLFHQRRNDALWDKINTFDSWVIIFDNANSLSDIKEYLPKDCKGGGLVLITSQQSSFFKNDQGLNRNFPLSGLEEDDAIQLLNEISGQGLDHNSSNRHLVQELDCSPLGIVIAGAYIQTTRATYKAYSKLLLAKHEKYIQDLGGSTFITEFTDQKTTLETALMISVEKVKKSRPQFAQLLNHAAYLANNRIPLELLVNLMPNADEDNDLAQQKIIVLLVGKENYSLIRYDKQSHTCEMHRSVQKVIRKQCQMTSEVLKKSINAILRLYPYPSKKEVIQRIFKNDNMIRHVIQKSASIRARVAKTKAVKRFILETFFLKESLLPSFPASNDPNKQIKLRNDFIMKIVGVLGTIIGDLAKSNSDEDLINKMIQEVLQVLREVLQVLREVLQESVNSIVNTGHVAEVSEIVRKIREIVVILIKQLCTDESNVDSVRVIAQEIKQLFATEVVFPDIISTITDRFDRLSEEQRLHIFRIIKGYLEAYSADRFLEDDELRERVTADSEVIREILNDNNFIESTFQDEYFVDWIFIESELINYIIVNSDLINLIKSCQKMEAHFLALNKHLCDYKQFHEDLITEKNQLNEILSQLVLSQLISQYPDSDLLKNKDFILAALKQNSRVLEYADAQSRNDKEVILNAVHNNGFMLKYASARLKKDKDVVFAAIKSFGHAAEYADPELWDDEEFVVSAIRLNGDVLQHANPQFRDDKDIISIAAKNSFGSAFRYASPALRRDPVFVLGMLRQFWEQRDQHGNSLAIFLQYGWELRYVDSKLWRDRQFVLAAVQQHGASLRFATLDLQKDKEIVLAAIKKYEKALLYASPKLWRDKQFVLTIVQQDLGSLKHVSPELKIDQGIPWGNTDNSADISESQNSDPWASKEFVSAVIRRNAWTLEYGTLELSKNEDGVSSAVQELRDLEMPLDHIDAVQEVRDLEMPLDHIDDLDEHKISGAISDSHQQVQFHAVGSGLLDNKEIVLAVCQQHQRILQSVKSSLYEDKNIVSIGITQHHRILHYADLKLWHDKEFVLEVFQQYFWIYKRIGLKLWHDKEFVLGVFQQYFWIYQRVDHKSADNTGIISCVSEQYIYMLERVGSELWRDRQFVFIILDFVILDFVIKYISPGLWKDKEFVLAAVKKNSLMLQYVDLQLRDDREIVLVAVRDNGMMLIHAGPLMQKDKEIVITAVLNNVSTSQQVSSEFWNDKDFVLAVVKQDGMALERADEELQSNIDIILAAITQNRSAFLVMNSKLKANRKMMLDIIKLNAWAFHCADPELRNNREFILAAVQINAEVLGYTKQRSREDKEIVLAALRQNKELLNFASVSLQKDPEIIAAAQPISGPSNDLTRVYQRHYYLGEIDLAIEALERLTRLSPSGANWHNLACLYHVQAMKFLNLGQFQNLGIYIEKTEDAFKSSINSFGAQDHVCIYTEYAQFLLLHYKGDNADKLEQIIDLLHWAVETDDGSSLSYRRCDGPTLCDALQRYLENKEQISISSKVLAMYLLLRIFRLNRGRDTLEQISRFGEVARKSGAAIDQYLYESLCSESIE